MIFNSDFVMFVSKMPLIYQTKLTLFQEYFQVYREGRVEKKTKNGITIFTSL